MSARVSLASMAARASMASAATPAAARLATQAPTAKVSRILTHLSTPIFRRKTFTPNRRRSENATSARYYNLAD